MLAGTADDFAAAIADGEMEYDFAAREAARRETAERAAALAKENARHAEEAAEIDALESVQADLAADEAYYPGEPGRSSDRGRRPRSGRSGRLAP